ncbi:O-acyltransferase like protein-like [Schistocerca cancellata]|uniref:O-acyltransferase like protein-like n=1 Tax=Schistocerca cancellata TaxID=274614 RepID=UPI0021198D11|nr:O-acyltransferase like protein-like [Schistocerca cancellata]
MMGSAFLPLPLPLPLLALAALAGAAAATAPAWPAWPLHALPGAARTPDCRRQAEDLLTALHNFTFWAVAMVDASAKLGSGVLTNPTQLGDFDECVLAARGRYCLAHVTVTAPEGLPLCQGQHCSAWHHVRGRQHRLERRRDVFRWGVCLPTSCGPDDAASLVRDAAALALPPEAGAHVTVSSDACHSSGDRDGRRLAPHPLLLLALAVYCAALVMCTLRHWGQHQTSGSPRVAEPWTASLSVAAGWRQLTERPSPPAGHLSCLDGLRALTSALVVFGHRADAFTSGPLVNADEIETLYEGVLDAILMNGHLIVDTFFTISGCLVALKLMALWDSGKPVSLSRLYIYRYLRMTPAYATVLVFQLYCLYGLGSGPLWKQKVGREVDNCRAHLWTNLLHVNNYVHADRPCLEPSWYVSVDMQLFAVAPWLLLAVRRYGAPAGLSALLLATAVPAALTFCRGLDPTFIPDPSTLGNNTATRTYLEAYVTTHCRAGAFVVGLMFGCWLHRLRASKERESPPAVLSLYPLTMLSSLGVVSVGWLLYQPALSLPPWMAAAYAGLHRPVYAVGVGMLITACAMGQAGLVDGILSHPVFRVPSRLTYCLYLTHSVAQMVHYASARSPEYLSHIHVVWLAIADYVVAMGLALLLHLLVEAPMLALTRHMFFNRAPSSKLEVQKSSLGKSWLSKLTVGLAIAAWSKTVHFFFYEPWFVISRKVKGS